MALRLVVGLLALLLSSVLLAAAAVGAGVLGVYYTFVRELPSADEFSQRTMEAWQSTRVYDRTGQHLLYEIMPVDGGLRTWVPLESIPEYLRNATVAMEDKSFYTNRFGLNLEGLARAAWGEIRGQNEGGGSSITQQLVRNVLMDASERMDRSYIRKVKEMVLAFELSRRYPGIEGRNQILEWYLNTIFYGHLSYGVEAASQVYFGKSASQLSLAEAAMIVPLGQSPALNPIDHYEEAKHRQELVLKGMAEQGYITTAEAERAKQETVTVVQTRREIIAPHFVISYLRPELVQRFGAEAVYGGGLQVITTLDLGTQTFAEQAAREQVIALGDKNKVRNAGVVVLDTKTAEIKAMVGSIDYDNEAIAGEVNMATSPRQPGSSFKPFTYATAFAQGYAPTTMVMDVRTSFQVPGESPYVPENFARNYHGPVLLRQALACSYNIPAVAMMQKVGPMKVVQTAHAMGINTLNDANYNLSLALGTGPVAVLDMAYAFSVFANGGAMVGQPVPQEDWKEGYRHLDPVAILKVTDPSGKVLWEYTGPSREQVIRADVAYLLTDIISDNKARTPAFGAQSALILPDRPVAAKTGTTNDFTDAWTVGFTPNYAVAVWMGDTKGEQNMNIDAVRVAAPVWQKIMLHLHDGVPVETFQRPPGIVTAIVDRTSGKQPTEYSAARMEEIFIEGTVPTEKDDIHRPFRVCMDSGKLAMPYCPADRVEAKTFEVYPSEAADWVRATNVPQPPSEYCDVHGSNLGHLDLAIATPKQYGVVRGIVPVRGNARAGGQQSYWLQFSAGTGGNNWQRIGPEHGERVDNGLLENWDTTGLDGMYTLQLTAMDSGQPRDFSVQVLVDNISPTVKMARPDPETPVWYEDDPKGLLTYQDDRVYEAPKDEWVNIQVDAVDNIEMARVEFFMDDQPIGITTVAPYSLRWNLVRDSAGPYTQTRKIHVVAYDSAGNESKTEPVEIHVIPERKREP